MAKKDDFDSLRLPPEDLPERPLPRKPAPAPAPPARPAGKPPEPVKPPEAVKPPVAPPAKPAVPPKKPPVPSIGPQSIVTKQQALDVCKHFALGAEAGKHLKEGMTTRQYLEILMEKELNSDATRFLAYALPKREGVWWACQAIRLVTPKIAGDAEHAIVAAEKWAAEPIEEHRRAAFPLAKSAKFDTPAGSAAAAAFWSGGSLAPEGAPTIAPEEHLTARAVAGSILLSAALLPRAESQERFPQILALGVDVANGKSRWKRPASSA